MIFTSTYFVENFSKAASENIFSTSQKQKHLFKSGNLWTLIFPIIARGIFKTQ